MAIGGYQLLERIDQESAWERWRARAGRREVLIEWGAARVSDPLRFEREVRAAASLRHTALPRIVAHGLDHGRPWVAHESAAGIAARDRFGAGRLCPDAALLLVHPIVDALSVLHSAGVVHGGVRIENVRIGPNGDVRLLGWSLVKARGVDPREDVRGLGGLLFELIAGHPPDGASLLEIDRRVSSELDAFVRSCMARDPARRPQNGRELMERLAPLLPSDDEERLRKERLALLADPSRWQREHGLRAAERALEAADRARATGNSVAALREVERVLAYGLSRPPDPPSPPPSERPAPPERSLPGWTHGLAAALGTALLLALGLGAMMWIAID